MEKTIQIKWEGKDTDVIIRSLTYGEYKKIKRKSVIVKDKQQFRDVELYDELFVLTSIKEAPFEKITSNLQKLSIEDGLKLEKEVEELNFPKDE